jgi:hypothetical protein
MSTFIHNTGSVGCTFSIYTTFNYLLIHYLGHFHRPTANLSSYQRGVYYASMNIFNPLPASTAALVINRNRVSALKIF